MSISGVGGSMGSYNYTYNTQSSPQKADFRKIFEEEKAEFYEKYKNGEAKPSYQIGGSSFTEEDWDKVMNVNLKGYFYWNDADSYEELDGYRLRFGLTWVDHETGERIWKKSRHYFSEICKSKKVN